MLNLAENKRNRKKGKLNKLGVKKYLTLETLKPFN